MCAPIPAELKVRLPPKHEQLPTIVTHAKETVAYVQAVLATHPKPLASAPRGRLSPGVLVPTGLLSKQIVAREMGGKIYVETKVQGRKSVWYELGNVGKIFDPLPRTDVIFANEFR